MGSRAATESNRLGRLHLIRRSTVGGRLCFRFKPRRRASTRWHACVLVVGALAATASCVGDVATPSPPPSAAARLRLYDHVLTDGMPLELTALDSLELFLLAENERQGETPPELGDMDTLRSLALRSLTLSASELTDRITPEFDRLTGFTRLDVAGNRLSGSGPSELVNLTQMWGLDVHDDGLTGSIPSELGDFAKLTELRLDDNGLTGPLPDGLMSLSLDLFRWNENAGLCAPDTSAFRAWLAAIKYHQPGPFCSGSDGRRRITQTGPGEVGPTGAVPDRSP